jgi:hypothetical protein
MIRETHSSGFVGSTRCVCVVGALALLALLSACQKPPYREQDLAKLLDAYRQGEAQAQERLRQSAEQSIRRLEVRKVLDGHQVSADLNRAPFGPVLRRILDQSQVPFLFLCEPIFHADVTARFENVPLIDAVNFLLRGEGLSAAMEQGVLIIREGQEERKADEKPGAPDANGDKRSKAEGGEDGEARKDKATASRTIPLKNMEGEVAVKFIQDLFSGEGSGGRVSVSRQPYTNTLTLLGPATQVAKAAALVRRMDADPRHVLIEALVVEFDSDELIELGTQLQNYAQGELKSLAAAFGIAGVPAVTFTYLKGAREAATVTALVNLMVSTGRARLISRPYLSTMSSREAQIDISQERYVVTQTVQGTSTVSSTEAVRAGIRMAITPFVLKDQRVQLKLSVEDSTFIDATIPNVSVVKDKNSATTSMLVESGQTVIIGGLALDRRTESNAGLPFLRHIPGLNILTAQQGSSVQKQEVVVFVTPHVWMPGMTLPLVEPHAFKVPEAREIGKPFDNEPQIRIAP